MQNKEISFHTLRLLLLPVLYCFLFSGMSGIANAQEPQPGDSCSSSGQFMRSGGPEISGSGYFIVCDGSNWIRILEYKNSGSMLFRLDYDSSACNTNTEGALRYDSVSQSFEGCNGSSWSALGGGGGGGSLAGLSDTDINSPQDGQPLVYDFASSKWINNSCDEAPNALNFTDLSNQSLSTTVSSNIIQIAGIACSVDVSLTGDGTPQYRICSNSSCSSVTTNWTVAVNAVNAGDYVQLRLTTSGSQDTVHTAAVTVGSVSRSWNVKTIGPKVAFATSQTYDGNLGGVSGADSKCQSAADAAGLSGSYLAWIASTVGATAPSNRFTHSSENYVRTDGVIIVDDWSDLVQPVSSFYNAINVDENGNSVTGTAWTNVYENGNRNSFSADGTCDDWTKNIGGFSGFDGEYGTVNSKDKYWTENSLNSCSASRRLYCFEQ